MCVSSAARVDRSPTAEQVFADWPGIETSSARWKRDAETPVTPDLLDWADLVFVMERAPIQAAGEMHGASGWKALGAPGDSGRVRIYGAGADSPALGQGRSSSGAGIIAEASQSRPLDR
jgi:hypothetical protein